MTKKIEISDTIFSASLVRVSVVIIMGIRQFYEV